MKERTNQAIGKGWVARDKKGWLQVYHRKPERLYGCWVDGGYYYPLKKSEFPNLKWEDEPIKVEIVIKVKNEDYEKETN